MNNLKGPFILTMTLLLLGTVGGGFAAYKIGTTHEAEAAAPAEGGQTTATSPETPAGQPAPAGGANATATEGAQAVATSKSNGEPSANGTAEPTSSSNPSGEAPAAGAATASAGKADAGKEVYASNCAGCHGTEAKGGVGPDLTAANGPTAWDDATFTTAIREGKTPEKTLAAMMPHFAEAQVSAEQANDLHAYLQSLAGGAKPAGEAKPAETKPTDGAAAPAAAAGATTAATPADAGAGNADAGKAVFASNCAGCHGAEAKGGVGPDLTAANGPKAWDDAAFKTAIREGKTPEKTLAAMMPHFADAQVSDTQVGDLHAYLKSLK